MQRGPSEELFAYSQGEVWPAHQLPAAREKAGQTKLEIRQIDL
jgi:hypothetical protein